MSYSWVIHSNHCAIQRQTKMVPGIGNLPPRGRRFVSRTLKTFAQTVQHVGTFNASPRAHRGWASQAHDSLVAVASRSRCGTERSLPAGGPRWSRDPGSFLDRTHDE